MSPMETFLWILAGGLLGWMSYAFLGLNESRGMAVSVAIGAAGALIGAKAIAPIFITSAPALDAISAPALFFAVAAAAVCLLLGNFVYRRWGV